MTLRLRRVSPKQWERLAAARHRYEPVPAPPRTEITAIELTLVDLVEPEGTETVRPRSGSAARS